MALQLVRYIFSKLFPGPVRTDFRKKAVFITGCDSGLGYNFAVHLHSRGVKVLAGVHDKQSPGAKSLTDRRIFVLDVDVTDRESVITASAIVERVISENDYDFFGLINNAGVMVVGEFEWQTTEMLKQQLSVNVFGPMNVIKHFLPVLRKQKGRIVNVSSHCAGYPLPGMAVYSATKAALRAFSLGLNHELNKFSIKVVDLVPGSFVLQSCIMSKQKDYSKAMADEMPEEVKLLYKEYFDRYSGYLESLPVPKPHTPHLIHDTKLYSKLEEAMFSPSPSRVYVNQPPRYFLYYTLFSIMPECSLKDYLVKTFIQMPQWNGN